MELKLRINREWRFVDFLMYLFLFSCIYTSGNWSYLEDLRQGEFIRFDKILLFGQIGTYHIFTVVFLFTLFFSKFGPQNDGNRTGSKNFLKTVFWIYFVPVNILIYLAIYIKDIPLEDLGVRPIVTFFIYLVIIYYVQDVFLKYKDKQKLTAALTVLQVIILGRCVYSIAKYFMGYGYFISILGKIRVGQENDFADFFILLFIISLSRFLFEDTSDQWLRLLHIVGILTSSYVAIFSFRRYFWIEYCLALGIILFYHNRYNVVNTKKIFVAASLALFFASSLLLLAGTERITQNYYVGRFITSLSLLDSRFESEYGTDTRHPDEIKEGWHNVKNNWLLGVTPYGGFLLERTRTTIHKDAYVHNAYLMMWLNYGLLGLILYVFLYYKMISLGSRVFFKYKNWIGLILFVFIICQAIKSIVWHTMIRSTNVTVVYIFLVSLVIHLDKLIRDEGTHAENG